MLNRCPNCGHDELYLIGATLRGKLGVKYEGAIKEALTAIEPEIFEGLLVCKNCKHQTTTRSSDALKDLSETDCIWETTTLGTKFPVVCPECGNKRIFTKVLLEQRTRAITYAPDETGVFKAQDLGAVLGEVEQRTLRYECDIENCNGVIVISERD
jgi:predicted RNA-binding Zn-ribbon protein involved in translation (DUF1610 family)